MRRPVFPNHFRNGFVGIDVRNRRNGRLGCGNLYRQNATHKCNKKFQPFHFDFLFNYKKIFPGTKVKGNSGKIWEKTIFFAVRLQGKKGTRISDITLLTQNKVIPLYFKKR
jgi:hypothetical protein